MNDFFFFFKNENVDSKTTTDEPDIDTMVHVILAWVIELLKARFSIHYLYKFTCAVPFRYTKIYLCRSIPLYYFLCETQKFYTTYTHVQVDILGVNFSFTFSCFKQMTTCYYSPHWGEYNPTQSPLKGCVSPTFMLAQR